MKIQKYLGPISALFLCLLASSSFAVPVCYSPEEMKAEQLLRLHSELLVITLTCHQSSTGDDLVPYYTGFTKANIRTLHEAEQTLIRHYENVYGGKGVDQLDKLRTKLANEFGQSVAKVSAPEFCAQRRDRVTTLYDAPSSQMDMEAQRLTVRSYERLCPSADVRIAGKGR